MADFASPGDFCPNETCPDYGKLQSTQLKKNVEKDGPRQKGHQRYRCLTCGGTFTQTRGTLFSRRRVPPEEIPRALVMLAEGSRLSSVSRTTGHTEETILEWLREASKHAQALEEVLMADYQVPRGQLDALWSYVGHKGEKKAYPETPQQGTFWRATFLDLDTRLRVARGLGKTEGQAAQEVFETLKGRGHPQVPPPLVSDGRGEVPQALGEGYGHVPSSGGRGRPPTRKRPGEGWKYLQSVKRRQGGRVVRTMKRVIYGDPQEVLSLFGESTAYVERTHLTSRLFNGRLVRKTGGFSKCVSMHRAAAVWEDAVYNLVRPLKTLRQKVSGEGGRRWSPRTPAMAAGLTDHLWTVKELLPLVPHSLCQHLRG